MQRSPPHHADEVQRFYTADFNPYLNYHRPCGFATIEVKDNGKRRRHYRPNDYRTPYEKAGLARGLGEPFEDGHYGRVSGATGAENERHRVRPADAATQENTARRLPHAALRARLATALREVGPGGPGLYIEGRGKGKRKKSSCWRQERAPLPPPP